MTFAHDLHAARPALVSRALNLCRDRDRAEDLAQETSLRALLYQHSFKGGNFGAWLFTILRQAYFGECKRERGKVYIEDMPGFEVPVQGDQEQAAEAYFAAHHAPDPKATKRLFDHLDAVSRTRALTEMESEQMWNAVRTMAQAKRDHGARCRARLREMVGA